MYKLLLVSLLLPQLLLAETFVREYTYNAGESDSKVSARKAAMRQIQVLVIEEVGVQVRSRYSKEENLNNEQYSKAINSKYESFAQAITKTKILDEKWDGERFYLKAEVEVDPDDLGKVFETLIPSGKNGGKKAPSGQCEIDADKAATMLRDLTSRVKIDEIVNFATSHPFDNECNKWQIDIVRTFNKHHITTPTYRTFLLKSLKDFKQIDQKDERAIAILSYLGSIMPFTIQDIDSVSTLLIKTNTYWLKDIFYSVLSHSDQEAGEEFISRILGALDTHKLGIPSSVDATYVSRHLTDVLYQMDNDLFEYYYEIGFDLLADYTTDDKHLSILANRYTKHRSAESLKNLLAFIKQTTPSCDIAREYIRTLNSLTRIAGGFYANGTPKEQKKTPYFEDIPRFFNETADFRKTLTTVSCREDFGEKIKMGYQPYLILNKIETADKLSPQQCVKEMFGAREKYVADRYGRYLIYYGEEAKKAKKEIVQELDQHKYAKPLYESGMIKNLLTIIENIKEYDDLFVDYLVNVAISPNTQSDHYKKSRELLFAFGKQSIDRLLYNYPQDHYFKSGDLIKLFTQYPIDKKEIRSRLEKLPKVDSMHDAIIQKTIKKLST